MQNPSLFPIAYFMISTTHCSLCDPWSSLLHNNIICSCASIYIRPIYFNNYITLDGFRQRERERWVPCHHGMARPRVADGATACIYGGYWIPSHVQTTRGGPPGREMFVGLTTLHRKKKLLRKPVNLVLNHRVPWNAGRLSSIRTTWGISSGAQLHS
jgi:hypothetical protein